MKRMISLLLSLLMLLGLLGCSDAQMETAGAVLNEAIEVADALLAEEEEAAQPEEEPAPEETSEEASAPEEEAAPAEEEAPAQEEQAEDAAPAEESAEPEYTDDAMEEETLPEDGAYTSKDDVALYIYLYGHLPSNFITKKEAQNLGWSGGSLEPYAPGMSIGGSRFGNYEGLLPEAKGRTYTECDIDTMGAKSRGAKRIVFSNDGLIYYTDDHYESFTLLYGEE